MAFVEEIPCGEDIKNVDPPFRPDLEKPVDLCRTWLADRTRGVYLAGIGSMLPPHA